MLLVQDIVALLEDQLKPLVQAELSVLVDVLHRPELLFPPGTEARRKCESGGFIFRYHASTRNFHASKFPTRSLMRMKVMAT